MTMKPGQAATVQNDNYTLWFDRGSSRNTFEGELLLLLERFLHVGCWRWKVMDSNGVVGDLSEGAFEL